MNTISGLRRVSLAAVLAAAFWPLGIGWAQEAPPDLEAHWFRNVRQLTSTDMGLARAGEAYFSPDVKRISFQAYPTGKDNYQIYVMNLDGTGLQMVSTGIGATTCSYFHPSGKKLIFAANHHDLRPAKVFDMKHSGGHPGQHPGKPPQAKAEGGHPGAPPGSHPGAAQQDSASEQPAGKHPGGPPKGRHSYAWQYFPGMDIYEYTFATGKLKRLTFADGYDAECAYSPDGRHIVFSSFRDGDQEIYICDADGKNPRRITHAKGKDGGPFFSPDGKRIVYRSDRHGDGNLQIFINNVEGTDEHAITGHETLNWCPYWHPSGKWLIFTRADFHGRPKFDLYLIRDDGSEVYRVTTDPGFDGLPVFSPDGRYLMWTSTRNGLDAPQIFLAEFIGLTPEGELRVPRETLEKCRLPVAQPR